MASSAAESLVAKLGLWQTNTTRLNLNLNPAMSLVDPQLITTTHLLALATCLIFSILLYKFSSPPLDPREPPVLRPKFPVIGHLLGLSRHGVAYFDLLRQSQGSSPVPAATLPIFNGKVYALWDLSMIHSAMRNKNLTFDVLSMEFAQRVFGLSNHGMEKLWGGPEHDIEKSVAVPTMRAIKPAMQGANLLRMNMAALRYISEILNSNDFAEQGLQVENLYKWLRHFMTMATAFGIYGEGNPIQQDEKGLIDALWEFESNMQPLFLGVAPQIVARKAYKAREKVQKVLIPWYKARMDDAADVSEIAKVRANTAREFGFPAEEVGRLEMALLFVGTTNTIPSLYLFLANVWLRPELKKEVGEEVRGIVSLTEKKKGKRTATIKIQELEEKCPVLVSCYREAIRLGNQAVGTRRVVQDTLLTDSMGNQHLFKAGVDVMWGVKGLHHSTDIWGEDAKEFDHRRFLEQEKMDKTRKQAYLPFGGGKHLCPGRNFAFAENLGLVAALAVGFEIEGLDGNKVKVGSANMGEAVAKPPADGEGGSVVVRRREGWEDVEWKFVCASADNE